MNRISPARVALLTLCGLLLGQTLVAAPALAYGFSRPLQQGDEGWDVKALEVRVAGWYPTQGQVAVVIDRRFGGRTTAALKAFQSFFGLPADGIAGPGTFRVLNNLQDADGSTVNFSWAEFKQNVDPSCSAKANADAGTFDGGMASPVAVRKYVRRLMWRLEALRAKGGGHPIGVNSGFRSVDYNDCIGGAASSQHMYGTAVDQRMVGVTNHRERLLGEATDFSGIGCYAQLTHNHFDIRIENRLLSSSRFWWWPKQNGQGQDLDDTDQPCFGEAHSSAAPSSSPLMRAVLRRAQLKAFEAAGEPAPLGYGD